MSFTINSNDPNPPELGFIPASIYKTSPGNKQDILAGEGIPVKQFRPLPNSASNTVCIPGVISIPLISISTLFPFITVYSNQTKPSEHNVFAVSQVLAFIGVAFIQSSFIAPYSSL